VELRHGEAVDYKTTGCAPDEGKAVTVTLDRADDQASKPMRILELEGFDTLEGERPSEPAASNLAGGVNREVSITAQHKLAAVDLCASEVQPGVMKLPRKCLGVDGMF
jgi:hypothetical protein